MDCIDDVISDLKKINQYYENSGNAETSVEPSEAVVESPHGNQEVVVQEVVIPEKHWYQFSDWFSRQDELLEAILRTLQAYLQAKERIDTTPPVVPEYPEIPAGIEPKLDTIALEASLARTLLEGFNFIAGQTIVNTAGTEVEIIPYQKTYLLIIRANLTNAGDVYLGTIGVSNIGGYVLDPGAAVAIQVDVSKKKMYVDADNNGDGISWMALVN